MSEKGNIGCIDPDQQKDYDFQLVGHVPSRDACLRMAPHMGPRCNPDQPDTSCRYIGYRKRSNIDFLKHLQKKKDCDGFLSYFRSLPKDHKEELIRQADPTQNVNPLKFLSGYAEECAVNPGFMDKIKATVSQDQLPMIDYGGECWVGGEKNKSVMFQTPVSKEACYLPIYLVPNEKDPSEPIMTQMMKTLEDEINRDREELQKLQDKIHHKEITRNVASRGTDPDNLPEEVDKEKKRLEYEKIRKPLLEKQAQSQKEYQEKRKLLNMVVNMAKNHDYRSTQLRKNENDHTKLSDKINSDLENLKWSIRESQNQNFLQDKITTALSILVVLLIIIGVFIMIYYLIKLGKPSELTNKVTSGKASGSNVLSNLFPTNATTSSRISNRNLSSLFD